MVVLTNETDLERLVVVEVSTIKNSIKRINKDVKMEKKKKCLSKKGEEEHPKSKVIIKDRWNETDNIKVNFKDINQDSWIEVEFSSKIYLLNSLAKW